MRIALVTETFLPSTDGVVTRLTQAIKYLQRQGHEVLVIAPDLGVYEYEGAKVVGIKPITLPFYRSKKFAPPSIKVKKIIEEFQPDIVHAANPALVAASAVRYAKQLNLPLIASYHTHVPKYMDYYKIYKPAKPLMWAWIRKLHNSANLNLCTSGAIKDELVEQNIKNLHVLQRGVDVENRHPKFYDEKMRDRLTKGDQSKKLLIFVGRLAIEKEIHKIKPLLDARDDLALAIIGDGPARNELMHIFKDTNTVFTGFLHGEELSKAFASGDAFVFPSVTETLGLVILEAMASGLPVVAAKSGPTMEQIIDGETGLLFENENVESMMAAIDRLENQAHLKEMKQNARQEAEKFAWDKASQQLFQYYQQTIEIHNKNTAVQK
ncbi:glycosyltransferase family 1 protein [Oceanobacillus piezotolerans]|uniref:Glycosyltransferase family 1 protein n=1 Tax=Oceanobacillus piezotolerans TaxID=2448030 RepID=A0A498DI91_9BACI|nr:glycosyltransferase family 1 protein [Oceanobacillus piezotolerans]RLL48259.1 glycosyltransferase family 1 protein [Oceanobacillus piezotolerans]